MSTRSKLIVNIVLIQIIWFVCVLTGARGLGWPALLAVGIGLAAHLRISPTPRRDLRLAGVALLLGLAVDTLLAAGGAMGFTAYGAGRIISPLFMLALWVNFSTAFSLSLRWLEGRHGAAALLGLIGGPVAYAGGARLGAITLGEPAALSLVMIGIAWALATPLLLVAARRLRRPFSSTRNQEA